MLICPMPDCGWKKNFPENWRLWLFKKVLLGGILRVWGRKAVELSGKLS
jgi:hypothetical protein